MLNTPFSPWPSFTAEEADAVSALLLSNRVNYWTGQETRTFEKEFARWSDTSHAVAVSNGTLALDLCLKALDIGPGDDVIVTPRSFIASVSTVVTAGARPVFADVDRDSQNLTAATIQAALTEKTRAVICVHLAGWPCDMEAILALCSSRGIHVIEDCAQAHGARIDGRSVGSFGAINAWSFCQDKIMTTGGEGGMVTTNDAALWSKAWAYKDHGKSFDAVYNRQHPPGFRWLHEGFGTNWRMLEMQAVIGRIQLARMGEWHAARKRNGLAILDACEQAGLRTPRPRGGVEHAFYRAYAFVEPERLASGWTRDRVVAEISAKGVPCFQGSCSEIYLEKAFADAGLQPAQRLPAARELGDTSMMLLTHPTLTEAEIGKTCDAIISVVRQALR